MWFLVFLFEKIIFLDLWWCAVAVFLCAPLTVIVLCFNNYFYNDFCFLTSDSKHFWHITFAVSSPTDTGLSHWFYWGINCQIWMKQERSQRNFCWLICLWCSGHVFELHYLVLVKFSHFFVWLTPLTLYFRMIQSICTLLQL